MYILNLSFFFLLTYSSSSLLQRVSLPSLLLCWLF